MNIIYPIISVLVISIISIVFALPFFMKKKVSEHTLVFLLSLSVGVLLATVFIGFLPEIYSGHLEHDDVRLEDEHLNEINPEEEHLDEDEDHLEDEEVHEDDEDHLEDEDHSEEEHEEENNFIIPSLYLILGFLIMFLLEKSIHYHHTKKCESGHCGHSHAYNLAPINLIGDGIHNFIDGLVIAGSYAVSIPVGIAATISIIFHEIPQEIADFGILLYSGFSKFKALVFNLVSALTAFIGVGIGIILSNNVAGFNYFLLPFAAGNFIYIAASNLVPELHRHCGLKDTFMHMLAIIIGVLIVVILTILLPGHVHG